VAGKKKRRVRRAVSGRSVGLLAAAAPIVRLFGPIEILAPDGSGDRGNADLAIAAVEFLIASVRGLALGGRVVVRAHHFLHMPSLQGRGELASCLGGLTEIRENTLGFVTICCICFGAC
jgi:hypothetical protein